MKKLHYTFAFAILLLTACNSSSASANTDTLVADSAVSTPVATQTIVIDVETLKPPKALLATKSYDDILTGLLEMLERDEEVIIARTRQTRPLVEAGNPFFQSMYRAYADHRPFELSPEALWLLICQGFSQHVNINAEELRHLFVDFEGKQALTVSSESIRLDDPQSPWERVFPQFTSQIAAHTSQELVNVLSADFTTSTPASRVASQITVMESMKPYFEYVMTICGIPQVILHGTPDDWQSVIDRTEFLRKYELEWWIDEMLPVLKKIKRASEGEVDKAFWKNMFKYHELKHEMCGDPETLADGWIVKFYPYDNNKFRNTLKGLYDGASQLPPELSAVPVKFDKGDGKIVNLTLWAGFVGIAQDPKTFALRPEIGWFITRK